MTKKILFCLLALMVVAAMAAPKTVKSKRGDIDLTKTKGGSDVVCTAAFADELHIVVSESVEHRKAQQSFKCVCCVFIFAVEAPEL